MTYRIVVVFSSQWRKRASKQTLIFNALEMLTQTVNKAVKCLQDFAGICGALFIVFGIIGAGALGPFVDKTKKFIEVTKINMCITALACITFSVVRTYDRESLKLDTCLWRVSFHSSE